MKKRIVAVILTLCTLFSVASVTLIVAANNNTVMVAEAAVLKQGSRGTVVRTVQTRLKNWGYMKGTVDGIFGAKTRAGVAYFQRTHGLSADGIVGSKTAAKLGVSLKGSSSSSNTSSDVYLLAKVVYAEARGEPYTGQVAVAAVVLNRVRSSSFPNTISGVVYEPWAFTCVNDGQINLSPNSSAQKAAQDAMNGWDPTNGCLFYYNPRVATSAWMRNRPILLNIGSHAFC